MSCPQRSCCELPSRFPAETTGGHRAPQVRHRDTRIFAVLAAGVFAFSLLQAVSVPTLPLLQNMYDTDHVTVSWTLTAFLLTATVTTPILGRLGDLYGTRRIFIWSLLALTLGSMLAAVSPSIGMLIAARAVQGLGAATLPLAFALIRGHLRPDRVAGAISLVASLLASGFAVGIVLCGPVTENLGIRWLFVLPALIAATAAVLTPVIVPTSRSSSGTRVPVLPAVLLSGWLVALLLAVTKAPHWGWNDPVVWILLGAATFVAACWAKVEWSAHVPLVDLRLMASRGVWTANIAALAMGIASYGWFTLLPQFNQTPSAAGYGFGATVSESGYVLLPAAGASFLSGFVAARLVVSFGLHRVLVLGCMLTSTGLAMTAALHHQVWQIGVAAVLCGLGSGLATACLANAVVLAVAPQHTAAATGMNANLRSLGGTLGTGVTAAILANMAAPSGFPLVGGYIAAFSVLSVAALCAAAAALLIPAGTRR